MSVGASAASRTSNLSMMRLCIFLSIFAVFPASNSSFSPLWRKEAIIIDSPHQVEHPIPRLSEWHTCLGIVTLQVTIAPIEDTVKSERARRNRIAAKQHRPIALGLRLTARVPGSRVFRSVRYHTSLSRRRQSRTVPPRRFAKRSRILKAQSGRALPTSERVERKECLRELAPESRLIAAEPVHDLTI